MGKEITQEVIVLPAEVSELAVQVAETKQVEVKEVLQQIFQGTEHWEKQVEAIEVKDVNDSFSIGLADVARKNAKTARLNAEKIFDAKRNEVQKAKAEFDLEDKLWLKAKQIMQIKFKAIEDKAEWKANFVKRFQAEQKELSTQKRIVEVGKYSNEVSRIEFENMADETFESFLNGLKLAYEKKIEDEKKAEAERIEREKEQERLRLETIRLKAEAEKREKEIEKERQKVKAEAKKREAEIEQERLKAKAEAEKLEAENRAKLKKEQEAKAKLQAELKAKQEAERKAEDERIKAEQKAKAEAEKLAKAPIKKQLTVWVESFKIPVHPVNHDKATLIIEKFTAFKKWAVKEIDNI